MKTGFLGNTAGQTSIASPVEGQDMTGDPKHSGTLLTDNQILEALSSRNIHPCDQPLIEEREDTHDGRTLKGKVHPAPVYFRIFFN